VRSEVDTSSWQSAGDVRPIADVYRSLPLVRIGRVVLLTAIAVAFVIFPSLFGTTVVVRMGLIFLFAITFMSLGVLTGWAGQLSLGQMAFAGVGAATSAWLTQRWHWDITLAALAAGSVGAIVSLVVGVPALRLRGAYLAVTTLAFAITVSGYFLNPRFFDWLPTERIERNPIFGVIDWSSSRAIYYVSLIAMLLSFVAVRGIRRSRTGRVLIALRDNEAAVESYGVSPVRAKLTAFAISGFLAAFAGSIVVHHQQALVVDDAGFNLLVFSGAVIGGLGSPLGAFLGSLYFNGTFYWLQGAWRLLASGIGLLGILLVAPGGLTGLWYDLRDLTLRWFGARRGIVEGDRAEDLLDGDEAGAEPTAAGEASAPDAPDANVEAATPA
jgi:branched-chain amino acid transport system permease protein